MKEDNKIPMDRQGLFPRDFYAVINKNKVIFLNDKNLGFLKGYKAYVNLKKTKKTENGEIHIIITGKSWKSAKILFDKLEALDPNEIISDNK
jgi:hypothetical protein